jgi:hypothetical protein
VKKKKLTRKNIQLAKQKTVIRIFSFFLKTNMCLKRMMQFTTTNIITHFYKKISLIFKINLERVFLEQSMKLFNYQKVVRLLLILLVTFFFFLMFFLSYANLSLFLNKERDNEEKDKKNDGDSPEDDEDENNPE